MVRLDSSKIARLLALCIFCLVSGSTITQLFAILTGHDYLMGLVPFFYLDGEANLPTWYSGATLLLAGVLAGIIGVGERTDGGEGPYWFGLAIIFTVLSADEVAGFHELLIVPVRTLLGVEGYLYFAWVIPAAFVLLLLAAAYARWFFRLPLPTKRASLLSAALYIGGGMGMEMIGANEASRTGLKSTYYIAFITVEETLEMAGVAVWLVTLLRYAAMRGHQVTVQFVCDRASTAVSAGETLSLSQDSGHVS